ncbi:MAG: alpha/beta fold hydrolase [Cyclobacteriaceae bacterium]|nr:alpha/beta fold hydrolase [Cyclobacteriaceae bacterium]MCB0498629.1 alpha/beta fold hydrolase [Cyclobacteriaceae bacterium]MCB9236804.1 alpha/beta fold hydrolase [Flammeovirgaceae bacterium]MCO5271594.1 alpha/beta fold hydrolase [Cyclobacteriaceae bacterium]MCW5901489.1 alpha/beta fold hydrolase [Cyclobacteriaceae bacterium]
MLPVPRYARPRLLFTNHLETIYPAVARKVGGANYQRERITTPDQDFLDLDWLKQNSRQLVIISHGLEGNTQRAYVRGMARAFHEMGHDVLAWNYRGCSGEMNRQLRFYHSGATDDLDVVVRHALGTGRYLSLSFIGFSLGGNLTLKYLGEKGGQLDKRVHRAVAISVPLDLHASCMAISRYFLYSQRFLKSLKKKVLAKAKTRPELETGGIHRIKNLIQFDDAYTAPLHHFASAVDYYEKCSSIHFIGDIKIPTLIVNAQNDPFLSTTTHGHPALSGNPMVKFENPRHGGHVGFALFNQNGLYWSELKALDFINGENV